MTDDKEPTINVEYIDNCYIGMSKALNIFAQRYNLKFEEIDIIMGRLSAEFRQKQMDMYVRYVLEKVMEDVFGIKPDDEKEPTKPKTDMYR